MALEVCNNIAPQTKLRLIETPTNNFVLVTNVLPNEVDDKKDKEQALNISTAIENLSKSFTNKRLYKVRDFSLHGVNKYVDKKHVLSGSYIIYKKNTIEKCLSLDKSEFITEVLRYVDAPGVLNHNNVCDAECLFWLLFYGPLSFCQSETCFGHQVPKIKSAFPVLLPSVMYEKQDSYVTVYNLAETYVYCWYNNYDFNSDASINEKMKERIDCLILELKQKFMSDEVTLWAPCSRMCLFCTLYNQNRLSLDCAKNKIEYALYRPVIIKDCPYIHTTVAISHILPGSKSAQVFPVYDIGKLLSTLNIKDNKISILD